ncbi:hypothetical protein QBC47DRAFT_388855 [Echria macrotheca]|uniref:Uncharacterized protein n=1 Tax=Echria macrotheca TaxID=438768 RepID=A0AAJ0F2N8_9PEZI|nr:hypothetical protein QBC47DRAFT_388855 [Echria macrotheca]
MTRLCRIPLPAASVAIVVRQLCVVQVSNASTQGSGQRIRSQGLLESWTHHGQQSLIPREISSPFRGTVGSARSFKGGHRLVIRANLTVEKAGKDPEERARLVEQNHWHTVAAEPPGLAVKAPVCRMTKRLGQTHRPSVESPQLKAGIGLDFAPAASDRVVPQRRMDGESRFSSFSSL